MARPPRAPRAGGTRNAVRAASKRRAQRGKGGRLADAENTLLAPPSKKEADRRAYISEWLAAVGVPAAAIRAEHQTDAGPIDLYLTNRRVILEIKQGGRLSGGPYAEGTGSAGTESAFEQVSRYVAAERARERLYLEEDGVREKNWIGMATDGRVWYAWEWQPMPSDAGDAPSRIGAWHGTELTRANIGRLAVLLDRATVGKEWASADMSHVFEDARAALERSFERRRALRDVRTQQGLWLEQLRGGGNAPDGDRDTMFVLHSMLILIARMISSRPGGADPRYGFVQWVGDSEVRMLGDIIGGYNWSQQAGDVMRALYRHFIPVQHRRVYGEYYTPDWLAELVCSKVIDDGFIGEQIRRLDAGKEVDCVLDPCCGSGTFLYHAAKRVAGSRPVRDSYLEKDAVARLVCRMVRGIEIHPVAVEMARANMRRIAPGAGEADIAVYQGDSLMTPRPEATLFGHNGDLPLTSPRGSQLIMPGWFVCSDARNVARFVRSACDDTGMPASLGADVVGYDREGLLRAHGQLREMAKAEANGAWLRHMLNQAGPMRLRGTAGRIVSNPPWVSYDKIQAADRRREVREMAEQLGVWAGGRNTKFDMAALFVDRCPELYMRGGSVGTGVSCWVLPRSAMGADTWERFRQKAGKRITGTWDVGTLPFGTATCVVFMGPAGQRDRRLAKKPGAVLHEGDTWRTAAAKTAWGRPERRLPLERSEWYGADGRPAARKGATIIPHCLVWAGSASGGGGGGAVHVVTKRARWRPWKDLGVLEGDVPAGWIRECVAAADLVPYLVRTSTRCILPLRGDGWDPGRGSNGFWRAASDLYEAHRGSGASTPRTLDANIDYNGKLTSQLGRAGEHVAYNKAGGALYAARVPDDGRILHDTVYYVRCRSRAEARFLSAVLNSEALRSAFLQTRRNGMDFAAHPWKTIPIPRYDGSRPAHRTLSRLAGRAERVAERACAGEAAKSDTTAQARRAVAGALREDGVSGEIDAACSEILPRHAAA